MHGPPESGPSLTNAPCGVPKRLARAVTPRAACSAGLARFNPSGNALPMFDSACSWEADTMLGTRGGYKARLLVCVERVSRYARLALLDNGLPETAAAAVGQHLVGDDRWPVLSITTDRGSEFATLHTVLVPDRLYVCDARRPNQRGSNENTIGLIRQFIPKGEPLSLQTQQSIAEIERLLNNRPRACLGFRTPAELLFDSRSQCRDSN